ncbi:hypothetical protein KM043_008192 [Ampulex compressa]|nr:hypothetical protein KM043_008192 [Ampulex compressa]
MRVEEEEEEEEEEEAEEEEEKEEEVVENKKRNKKTKRGKAGEETEKGNVEEGRSGTRRGNRLKKVENEGGGLAASFGGGEVI